MTKHEIIQVCALAEMGVSDVHIADRLHLNKTMISKLTTDYWGQKMVFKECIQKPI